MTDKHVFSDQDLSAFLDGEADEAVSQAITEATATDAAVQARLDELRAGEAAFAAAMQSALSAAPEMPDLPVVTPKPANFPWRAGLSGVAIGAIAAIGLTWSNWQQPEMGWKDVVANYQSLYVTETLAQVDQPMVEQQADLRRLSETLGIDLTALPQVEGLSFKRAQQLGFNGRPLAQLTFLTADGGPVALCILQTNGESSDQIAASVLRGMDTYNWTDNGYGVLLIGPKGDTSLENAAESFRNALKDASV